MKNTNLKWTSMIVAIMLFALVTGCKGGNEERNNTEEAENMEIGDGTSMDRMNEKEMVQDEAQTATVDTEGAPAFMVNYMAIKNALVNDDHEKAKQAASDMQNSLADSKLSEEQQNELKASIEQLAEAQNIQAQRQQFAALSRQLYEAMKNTDLADKTLYWQHCPMALNMQGANWLSYEKQVQNPFMGQKMPGCGSVEETLD